MVGFGILSLRVGVCFIWLMLPVETWNPYKPAKQTKWDPALEASWFEWLGSWTKNWVNNYALVRPYQLWSNVTPYYFLELENMTDTDCPRVYYPACGTDGVTYVNACILRAVNASKFLRFGPCLFYRRNFEKIVVPKKWRVNKTELEKIKKNFVFTKENFVKMLDDSDVPKFFIDKFTASLRFGELNATKQM